MNLSREEKREMIQRISLARQKLIKEHPFYGTLAMRLSIGLSACKTAFIDMRHLVFDPEFLTELSEKELIFVIEHEVLHCVLQHCTRSAGKNQSRYNIAADYVVNSNILLGMGEKEMMVADTPVFHRLPNGHEAYEYTTEQVYEMLGADEKNGESSSGMYKMHIPETCIDNHDYWDETDMYGVAAEEWKAFMEQLLAEGLSKGFSGGAIPPAVRKIEADYKHKRSIEWRVLLRDYITRCEGGEDYNFLPPERRTACLNPDVFLPGLNPADEEKVENIWFLVDTSGSINDKVLSLVYSEIQYALEQVKGLKGILSFFDTSVTKPEEFSDKKTLNKLKPVGRGGTSFHCMFRYMNQHMMENPPKAIFILTDGLAFFPKESAAKNVPVVWIMIDSEIQAPWGKCIHIYSETKA